MNTSSIKIGQASASTSTMSLSSMLFCLSLLFLWLTPVAKGWLATNVPVFAIVDLTILTSLLVVLAMAIRKRHLKRLKDRAASRFLVLHVLLGATLLISLVWTSAPEYGLDKSLKFCVFSTVGALAPILIFKSLQETHLFSRMLIVVSIGFAIGVIFFPSYSYEDSLRVSVLNSNPLNPAFVMAVGCSLCLLPGHKMVNVYFRITVFVLLEIGIYTTGSRSMSLQPIMALCVYGLINTGRHRNWLRAGLVILALAFVFSEIPQNTTTNSRVISFIKNPVETITTSGRMPMWIWCAENSIDSQVLLGHGTGSIAKDYFGRDERHFVHNIFLEMLYENGLMGLFLMLGLFGGVLVMMAPSRRTHRKCSEFQVWYAASVAAIFSVFSHWPVSDQRLLWFMLGTCIAVSIIAKQSSSGRQRVTLKHSLPTGYR